eukprot:CAMPEP_0174234532 /NCGR_PEP_ID=MMETSP0417-20130205/4254_1 /TAXON_ID=242541 /ORGANISM="Mayorella sp, Strain BSH-02190019" /LENGTH=1748 /DNA_ID=CAMNT_0015312907 /DNA_START=288 /DNA_END=5534 /DNA_ORIENTATION=-
MESANASAALEFPSDGESPPHLSMVTTASHIQLIDTNADAASPHRPEVGDEKAQEQEQAQAQARQESHAPQRAASIMTTANDLPGVGTTPPTTAPMSQMHQQLQLPAAMRERVNSMPGINGGSGGDGRALRLCTAVSRFGMPDRRLTMSYYHAETVWQTKLRLFVTRFDCLSSHDPRGMRLTLVRSSHRGSDDAVRSYLTGGANATLSPNAQRPHQSMPPSGPKGFLEDVEDVCYQPSELVMENDRSLASYELDPNDLVQCTFIRYSMSSTVPLELSTPASIHYSVAYGAGTRYAVLDLPSSFYILALTPLKGQAVASTQSPMPFTCAIDGAEAIVQPFNEGGGFWKVTFVIDGTSVPDTNAEICLRITQEKQHIFGSPFRLKVVRLSETPWTEFLKRGWMDITCTVISHLASFRDPSQFIQYFPPAAIQQLLAEKNTHAQTLQALNNLFVCRSMRQEIFSSIGSDLLKWLSRGIGRWISYSRVTDYVCTLVDSLVRDRSKHAQVPHRLMCELTQAQHTPCTSLQVCRSLAFLLDNETWYTDLVEHDHLYLPGLQSFLVNVAAMVPATETQGYAFMCLALLMQNGCRIELSDQICNTVETSIRSMNRSYLLRGSLLLGCVYMLQTRKPLTSCEPATLSKYLSIIICHSSNVRNNTESMQSATETNRSSTSLYLDSPAYQRDMIFLYALKFLTHLSLLLLPKEVTAHSIQMDSVMTLPIPFSPFTLQPQFLDVLLAALTSSNLLYQSETAVFLRLCSSVYHKYFASPDTLAAVFDTLACIGERYECHRKTLSIALIRNILHVLISLDVNWSDFPPVVQPNALRAISSLYHISSLKDIARQMLSVLTFSNHYRAMICENLGVSLMDFIMESCLHNDPIMLHNPIGDRDVGVSVSKVKHRLLIKRGNDTTLVLQKFSAEISEYRQCKFFFAILGAAARKPHLLGAVNGCLRPTGPFVLIKYYGGGNLAQFLTVKPVQLSVKQKLILATDIAMGICELHSLGMVHSQFCSGAVVLSADHDAAAVANFHLCYVLSRVRSNTPPSLQTTIVSQWYSAPEVQNGGEPTRASDIYSLAVVLWELWYGRLAYRGVRSVDLRDHVCTQGMRPQLFPSTTTTTTTNAALSSASVSSVSSLSSLSSSSMDSLATTPAAASVTDPTSYAALVRRAEQSVLHRLMERCWHADPAQRPSAEEVVSELSALRQRYAQETENANSGCDDPLWLSLSVPLPEAAPLEKPRSDSARVGRQSFLTAVPNAAFSLTEVAEQSSLSSSSSSPASSSASSVTTAAAPLRQRSYVVTMQSQDDFFVPSATLVNCASRASSTTIDTASPDERALSDDDRRASVSMGRNGAVGLLALLEEEERQFYETASITSSFSLPPNASMQASLSADSLSDLGDSSFNPYNFYDVFNDPSALEAFQNFLRSEWALENLSFYQCVTKLEDDMEKGLCDPHEFTTRAVEIFIRFVAPNAPEEINISYPCRQSLIRALTIYVSPEGAPDRRRCSTRVLSVTVFHTAKTDIEELLVLDAFKRYTKSDLFYMGNATTAADTGKSDRKRKSRRKLKLFPASPSTSPRSSPPSSSPVSLSPRSDLSSSSSSSAVGFMALLEPEDVDAADRNYLSSSAGRSPPVSKKSSSKSPTLRKRLRKPGRAATTRASAREDKDKDKDKEKDSKNSISRRPRPPPRKTLPPTPQPSLGFSGSSAAPEKDGDPAGEEVAASGPVGLLDLLDDESYEFYVNADTGGPTTGKRSAKKKK